MTCINYILKKIYSVRKLVLVSSHAKTYLDYHAKTFNSTLIKLFNFFVNQSSQVHEKTNFNRLPTH